MVGRKRLVLILVAFGLLLASGTAIATVPQMFEEDFNVMMGTHGVDELRGGPGDDLLASEGAWGESPEDTAAEEVRGAGGDDLIDTVSDPPSKDVVGCGPGEDKAQVDPEDEVSSDCERVDVIDLSKGPQPPRGVPEYLRAPDGPRGTSR